MRRWQQALCWLRSDPVQGMADLVFEASFLALVMVLFFSRDASNVALILFGLSWMVRRLAVSPFLPPVSLRFPLLFFLISLALSAVFSETRSHSLQQLFSEVPKVLVIFFGSLEYLKDQARLRRLFWAATWVILIIGVDGLLQFFNGHDLIRGAGLWKGRVRAHFPSPTFFEYPLPFFPLSLLLMEERTKWWKRALVGLAAISFAASSVLSQTRSVWIALAFTLLFLTLFSRHKLPYLIFIGCCLLALALLPMTRGKQRLLTIGDFFSQQRYQRILGWQISYRMFLSRPLLGKGLDIFDKYKRNAELQKPYLPPPLYEKVTKKGSGAVFPIYHPHNIYLEILASQGLVGIASFTSLLVALALSLWRRRRGPPLYPLATSASLLSFLICAAAGTSFYHFWSYAIFWLLFGMGMAFEGEDRIGS